MNEQPARHGSDGHLAGRLLRPGHMKPQAIRKHPPDWEGDLNPHRVDGQNIGQFSVDADEPLYASQLKDVVRLMHSRFNLSELREIPVLRAGTQLKQGAVYLDICSPGIQPFVATHGMVAGERNRLVPKAETPFEYWNRLIGIEDPERTHRAR